MTLMLNIRLPRHRSHQMIVCIVLSVLSDESEVEKVAEA
jgi:hypothetical protein